MTKAISVHDIQLRKELLPGDLGYIAYLHGRLYVKELGYGLNFERYVLEGLLEFSHQYDPSKDRVWICEHKGETIGCLVGFLWTTQEQNAAISLYTRYGFRLTEEKNSDAFDKLLVERRYDLEL